MCADLAFAGGNAGLYASPGGGGIGKRRGWKAARLSLEVKTVRTRITLACTECKQRNYNTKKDKKEHPERLETKKYCKFCRKHTVHKETK